MSENKFKKRSFPILLLALAAFYCLIFVIIASLLSLFGYSIWSWVNVLRFIIGGVIVLVLLLYGFLIKKMLYYPNEKK